jgi:hypothetical protein
MSLEKSVKITNVSITLSECVENHHSMKTHGTIADVGQGLHLCDLEEIKQNLEEVGVVSHIMQLECYEDMETIDVSIEPPEDAYVLIIPNAVNMLLQLDSSEFTQQDMYEEQCNLKHDKQAFMKGKVVNKHARWNLCFGETACEPAYNEKQGTIVAYDDVPITQLMISQVEKHFGAKAVDLRGEGNYYYDPKKTGIGFHGDAERRKVFGIRLADEGTVTPPLHFQWFRKSKPIGERIIIPLNAGDMYVMSEKAVGTDWLKKNIYTLRHATGAPNYTTIKA